ncbi:MAG TPA: site-2 protease family protein [Candidatus Paceibacterota bacterium]
MENSLVIIFELAVLIFSVMVHEISHGAVALRLGDPTAKNAGRLTLNPLRHIDPMGSILLPLLMFALGGPIFGWAKPVPVNPLNVKNPKRGLGIIGAAGPISNLILAAAFGILLRLLALWSGAGAFLAAGDLVRLIILINIALAVFNLLPIPPLDGSNILFSILPPRYLNLQRILMAYGFYILLFLILFNGLRFLIPVIEFLYKIIAGV